MVPAHVKRDGQVHFVMCVMMASMVLAVLNVQLVSMGSVTPNLVFATVTRAGSVSCVILILSAMTTALPMLSSSVRRCRSLVNAPQSVPRAIDCTWRSVWRVMRRILRTQPVSRCCLFLLPL